MASSSESCLITSRRQLACVLRQAAQLEHLLACQYLFAGFTLRKQLSDFPAGGDEAAKQVIITRNQRWGFKVMQIARQEMEHLGIVTNLLGAIGEEPYFDRPNFPLPATLLPIRTPFLLQRFGRATLERFLAYERPDFLQVPDAWRGGGPPDGCVDSEDCGIVFRDVQQLYDDVDCAFQNLPPGEIFVGDTQRQVDDTDAPLAGGLAVQLMPVTNRDDAATAIGLILEQGEGIGDFPNSPDSHFASFNQILQEFLETTAEDEEAAVLPVVESPILHVHNPCSESATRIENPTSRQAMELFNQAYGLMLACLDRFFKSFLDFWGRPSVVSGLEPLSKLQQRTRNAALMEIAFFPFMTMVIRPLGDYVCRLPAFDDDDPRRAGPSFELRGGRVPAVDDFPAAVQHLADDARKLEKATRDPEQCAQVAYMAENISRMAQNFARLWNAVDA